MIPAMLERPRTTLRWHIGALLAAGAVLEAIYLAIWVFGYPISQAADWSVAFLTQHQDLWDAFRPWLEAAQARWPEGMFQTEWLVGLLILFFTLAFLAYGTAIWVVGRVETRTALVIIAGWALIHQLTFALLPALFTTDLFSYATYGRLPAIYGLNPFIYYPALIPYDTIASWIHPIWHYAPSVYGPLWIDFSVLLARSTVSLNPADQIYVYRLTANVAHLLNAGLILAILRPSGGKLQALGFLLYVWNPLVVFEFAANGHNDAVMITFVLAGLLATRSMHPSVGVALVTCGALIKPAAVLVLPLFVWFWLREERDWKGRGVAVVGSGVLVLGLAALLYAPWYEGPETFGPVILWSTISPLYINYVPDFIAQRLALNAMSLGVPFEQAWLEARDNVKLVTRVMFIGYYLGELWFLRKWSDIPAACARVFIAFLLLVNTWVLAWYFTWSLAAVAIIPSARWLGLAVVGMTGTAMTVTYYHHFLQEAMPNSYYAFYLAPVVLVGGIQLCRWALRGVRLGRETAAPVPQAPGTSFR